MNTAQTKVFDASILDVISRQLSDAPIAELKGLARTLDEEVRNCIVVSEQDGKAASALRRRIYRRINEVQSLSKMVPAPNPVVSTELLSRAVLLNQAELWLPFGETLRLRTREGDLSSVPREFILDDFDGKLNSVECSYIHDAICNFVRVQMTAGSGEVNGTLVWSEDRRYYTLSCSFQAFCRAGGIKGAMRSAVRDALRGKVNDRGEVIAPGLLEYVRFFTAIDTPSGKIRHIVEKSYIHREEWHEIAMPTQLTNTIALEIRKLNFLVLRLDAEIFGFLHREPGVGYLWIPQQLSRQIEDTFAWVRRLEPSQFRIGGRLYFEDRGVAAGIASLVSTPPRDIVRRFRPAILKILRMWSAGRNSRGTRPMTVDWEHHLVRFGLLPRHLKDKVRRHEDIAALLIIPSRLSELGSVGDIGKIEVSSFRVGIQISGSGRKSFTTDSVRFPHR